MVTVCTILYEIYNFYFVRRQYLCVILRFLQKRTVIPLNIIERLVFEMEGELLSVK
jgi:hypothetical protein